MHQKLSFAIVLIFCAARASLGADAPTSASAGASAGDWPQWRGPSRDGISTEKGFLEKWPDGGPKLLWTAKNAGGGYGTMAIARGLLYLMGDREDGEYLLAYEIAGGKEGWATKFGPIYPSSRGAGPRGTPTVDGDLVYAFGTNGHFIIAEAKTGKETFHLDALKTYHAENPHWGLAESPLIEKGMVIITPGGSEGTVVALDKLTGKEVWALKVPKEKAAYSSAVAADLAGIRQIVVMTHQGVLGIEAASGKLLWRFDKANNGVANCATPVIKGDHVWVSSDYGQGGALLKIVKSGSGAKAQEVYFSKRMQNHHSSSILIGEHLYGYSGNGPALFTCMEWMTGNISYPPEGDRRSQVIQKGAHVYAEGRFYCLGEEGEMSLVAADPKELKVISRFTAFGVKPDEKAKGKRRNTWAHPVVAGGRLYLRNQDEVFCYDIKR